MPTIHEALQIAVRHHQAGQVDTAAEIYQAILKAAPDQADALHLLGVVLRRRGNSAGAIRLIRRALAAYPPLGDAYINLGHAVRDLGDDPAACYLRAVRLNPGSPDAQDAYGDVLRGRGLFAASAAAHRAALRLRPLNPESWNGLGNALQELDDGSAAPDAYRRAIALRPDYVEAWGNLGVALRAADRLSQAVACQRVAIRLRPDFAAAYSSLGNALEGLNQVEQAQAAQRSAIICDPGFANAHNNLANALQADCRLDLSLVSYRRANLIEPGMADARRNYGIARLLAGDLAGGWPLYESRWQCRDAQVRPAFVKPQWDGGPVDGKVLLLYGEQGLGDVLHFCRYIPLLAARGGRSLLATPSLLHRVLAGLPGLDGLLKPGDPMPHYDFHSPLLSLPHAFGTDLSNIPADVPYLNPEPALVAQWAERLERIDPGHGGARGSKRVGIVWAGSPGHRNDRNRTIALSLFAGLSAIPGVRLFSLQKGPEPEKQAADPPDGVELVNLSPEITDFADTAAIASSLDLVVTCDTSVAHLCGALGRPVWVMLPFAPDWRWLMHRSDSPWYPTLRLYRQERRGDWAGVLAAVGRDLARLAGDR